ncbi:MAG: AFG1 family ATPase [Cohaesibacteraceae bacterium]|nr:AFG1 family ATPase [Cohaesibacteraceae bacterium]MBL4875099.1 AFG1 family ATPase [Cohaesibacteraceae bacterium]
MQLTVLERLKNRIQSRDFEEDSAQIALACELDEVLVQLDRRRLANKGSSLGWLFSRKSDVTPVKGLYIWGDVGRGKTVLMDMFFESVTVRRKKRVHFHEFMDDVHLRIHAYRQEQNRGREKKGDPIVPIAEQMAREIRLLCFDEFSVTDIADAMLLGRLFTRLFEEGVVVIATSNVIPDELYRDGLNRQLFLPFISLLQQYTKVYQLDARTDFRLEKLEQAPVYHFPLGKSSDDALQELWVRLTGTRHAQSAVIPNKGREIPVPQATGGFARFGYAELCEQPLGVSDFLRIAQAYHTVFVDRIPILNREKRNEAKRFINLIDAFYDNNVKLICSADADPAKLYDGGSGTEAFEFQRISSRLIEMQSEDYLGQRHGRSST